jgi:murein DD-endopeptidase MepM/ murein hydrolase activator NlpD
LRRTFPQKVKPVPFSAQEQEVITAQAKQALPETNRRVRTSAAMIGLAISMGAYNLPIPCHEDSATAAEPKAGKSTQSPADAFETAALSPEIGVSQPSVSSDAKPFSIKHTVQEGQTLWDVAKFYGTDVAVIASVNHLSADALLRVGQVLVVPTDSRIAQSLVVSDATITPGYYGPVAGSGSSISVTSVSSSAPSSSAESTLKSKQDEALKSLQQKRNTLRAGLTTLTASGNPGVQPSQATSKDQSADQTATQAPSLEAVNRKSESVALPTALPAPEQKVAFRSTVQQGSVAQPSPAVLPNDGVENSLSYQVDRGDTLATIARAHGVSLQELIKANRISNPDYIFANQVLVIPQSQTAKSSKQEFKGAIASLPAAPKALDVSTPVPSQSASVNPVIQQETRVTAGSSFGSNTIPAAAEDSTLLQTNNVENLKLEIEKLREKYSNQGQTSPLQAQDVSSTQTTVAALPNVALGGTADRVNPEFNPERYSNLNSRIREMRERIRSNQVPQAQDVSTSSASKSPAAKSQLVAAAPLGSESYDPLIQSRLGKTVSPELPPLGPGNEYLPGAPGRFEGYIWPTKGLLTSGFGWRWGRMHKGIDIAGPIGTPVVAAADGVVVTAGWNSGGYGYLVEIQHPDGSLTLYAHNNRILVQVGQQVAQGQQISEMGSTGFSTGPHCHFEVHPSGRGAVNPIALLPNRS